VGERALIGRVAELATLADAVRTQEGGSLALSGPAGVGKSRLAREAAQLAREHGATVLTGRAVPGSAALPYRPLVEALAAWARNAPAVDLGPYARALDVLVPGHRTDEPLSPVFVAEGLLRALLHLGPTLLLLEDLHWADEETLAAVEYLADNASSLPLLLVMTTRDDEGASAARLLRALSARGAVRLLPLAALDLTQTQALAEDQLGTAVSPALARQLVERTDGLPLFVEELLRALAANGGLADSPEGLDVTPAAAAVFPSSVADTVAARLEGLPNRQVLETAALLGRSFDHALLSELHGEGVAPALQAATDLGLLHEDPDRPGRLRFRHALLRDGVLASTFPPTRTALARAALDVLQHRDLNGDDLVLAQELAVRAGDSPLATRLSLRRAEEALDTWAIATAEQCLAQARHHAGGDPVLLSEIDLQQLRVASFAGRIDVVERVAAALLSRPDPDDVILVESHLRLAQALLEDGRAGEAEEHLQLGAPVVARSGDDCTFTRLELHRSTAALLRGDSAEARDRAVAARKLAEPFDDQLDLVCSALLHEGRAHLPDVDAAKARWTEGLQIADAAGYRLWRGRMLCELGGVDGPAGAEALREAEQLAREAGAVELLGRTRVLLARLALLRGDVDEAESLLPTAPESLSAPSRRTAEDLRAALADVREGNLPALLDAPPEACADLAKAVEGLPALAAACFTLRNAEGAGETREPLLAAVATFDRLGLAGPAEACRAMLRADGVPLPRRATAQDGVPEHLRAAGVTTRELDVLQLLAEGRTNRDIAAALYLSPRTVEKHVERLMMKSGAANRTALAALLRSPGTART
jgi:DNA-binding CsgD family transcriptional regulator